MKAFDPDPRLRWLFCLTHPDDEVAIAAWVRRLVLAGCNVSLSWTHHNAVREREARAAARLLGVPQSRLYFHGATDGSVLEELPQLAPQFSIMLDRVQPHRTVCCAFEHGHLDHDATNYLIHRTFSGTVCEFPMYHTYTTRLQRLNEFATQIGAETMPLTQEEQCLKKQIAQLYPSQSIWRILRTHHLFHAKVGRRDPLFTRERLRIQTHKQFLKPHLPPGLAEKVVAHPSWQRWVAAISEYERQGLG